MTQNKNSCDPPKGPDSVFGKQCSSWLATSDAFYDRSCEYKFNHGSELGPGSDVGHDWLRASGLKSEDWS